jgi:hypothetical protein
MAKWLFDSAGIPIAFINDGKVFSGSGLFLGRLEGSEIWHGSYRGEIMEGDRLLYKINRSSITRGTPGTPGTPGIPGTPGSRGSISLPSGYRDVQ